jgi:hypothetical protein
MLPTRTLAGLGSGASARAPAAWPGLLAPLGGLLAAAPLAVGGSLGERGGAAGALGAAQPTASKMLSSPTPARRTLAGHSIVPPRSRAS